MTTLRELTEHIGDWSYRLGFDLGDYELVVRHTHYADDDDDSVNREQEHAQLHLESVDPIDRHVVLRADRVRTLAEWS